MEFPAASRAVAVNEYCPGATPVVSQETEYVLVVSSAPKLVPLRWNCTPTTPTLSVAVAGSVTIPDTVLPLEGAVRLTEGDVVSVGGAEMSVLTSMEGRLSLPLES